MAPVSSSSSLVSTAMTLALRVRDAMLSILSLTLFFLVVFWISAFVYGSLYFFYMPTKDSVAVPVNLVFTPCGDGAGEGRCSDLTANVPVAEDVFRFLPGEGYRVGLHLRLPPAHNPATMIMFGLAMADEAREVVYKSERSAMPPYRTRARYLLESAVFAPLEVLQLTEYYDEMSVVFPGDFVPNVYKPARSASVTVSSRTLDVVSAELRIHSHFTGLRYFMYHHPVLSSFLGITSIATLVFTLLFFFWTKVFEPGVVVRVGPPRSDSAPVAPPPSLAERQERAREALNRSPSQQRLVQKISLGNLAEVSEVGSGASATSAATGDESSLRTRRAYFTLDD